MKPDPWIKLAWIVSAGHKGSSITLVERKTLLAKTSSYGARPPAQHKRQPSVASSLSAALVSRRTIVWYHCVAFHASRRRRFSE